MTSLLSGSGIFGGGNSNNFGSANYGLESTCPEGVNQNTALLATAAAIAVGAAVIFRAITLQQGRRRRRGAGEEEAVLGEGEVVLEEGVLEMVMSGIKKYRDMEES